MRVPQLRRWSSIGAVLIVLAVAAAMLPAVTAQAKPTQGTVTGKVVVAGAEAPVPGIGVEAYQLEQFSVFGGSFQAYGFVTSTSTAANGTYALTLPATAAGYLICFNPADSSNGLFGVVDGQCYDGQPDLDLFGNVFGAFQVSGTTVIVAAGKTVTGINGALDAPGIAHNSLSGTISGAGGPVANATVYVMDRAVGVPVSSTTTDTDGSYSLSVPDSTVGYAVCVDASAATGASRTGYQSACRNPAGPWHGLAFPVPAVTPLPVGTDVAGVNLALASGGAITGTVEVYLLTNRIQGAVVYAMDSAGRRLATAVSDVHGSYALLGLPPTPVAVCFDGSRARSGGWMKGYKDQCYLRQIWSGSGAPAPKSTLVTVAAGAVRTHIDGTLFARA